MWRPADERIGAGRMTTRTITVVSGGLRVPSSTRLLADQLARSAEAAFAEAGDDVELRRVELRDHGHAIVDALLTGFPTGELRREIEAVTTADALIVVTPTFQGSYGGLFKSFFDLVEAGTLRGAPVLLAATGGTERHSLVIEHALRPLFSYLGAVSIPTGVYAATADFGGDGAPALATRIERAGRELARLTAASVRPAGEPALVPFADQLAATRRADPPGGGR
jgi:FMN reductase